MRHGTATRGLCGLLACVLGVGPWVRAGLAEETPASKLAAAKEQYEDGSFEGAATMLRELVRLELEPQLGLEASLYLGLAEMQAGREDAALEAFGEVLRRQPDFRLDPVRYAPKLVDAFERARALYSGQGDEVLGITILKPDGVLGRAEKAPKAFASKWYQKWWVLALGGAVATGAVLIASTGSNNTYDPPVVTLSITSQKCGTGELYLPGDLRVLATRTGGEEPYNYTFTQRELLGGDVTVGTLGNPAPEVAFTYPGLRPLPTGACREYTLSVRVTDGRSNPSEDSRTLRVCPICI